MRQARACVIIAFSTLSDHTEEYAASHPLGCHRRRIPDRVVFEHVVLTLVHGSGYERIASPGCSDRTIRRRVKQWADLGIAQSVHALALEAYDRMIGLALTEISVDGCITNEPLWDQFAALLPVPDDAQRNAAGVGGDGALQPLLASVHW